MNYQEKNNFGSITLPICLTIMILQIDKDLSFMHILKGLTHHSVIQTEL